MFYEKKKNFFYHYFNSIAKGNQVKGSRGGEGRKQGQLEMCFGISLMLCSFPVAFISIICLKATFLFTFYSVLIFSYKLRKEKKNDLLNCL